LSRRRIVWLIPILLTLHNAEEAAAFRRYWTDLPVLLPTPIRELAVYVSYQEFLRALLILSLIVFLLALLVDRRPEWWLALWLLLATEAAIGLNAVVHVATAGFVFHGYSPGLVTAVALTGPFAVYCLFRARRDRWISQAAVWALLPAALFLHGPVLIAALWLSTIRNAPP